MTRDEAQAEAMKRWGIDAMTFDRVIDPVNDITDPVELKEAVDFWASSIARVGRYWVGRSHILHGNGNTWQDAFLDADKRQGITR